MKVPLAWSGDVTQLARALSTALVWCWLDGSGDEAGENWSYLGVADELIAAEPGNELEFLTKLRSRSEPALASDPPPDSDVYLEGFSGGWVTVFGYEFGVALMGIDPVADSAAPAFALHLEVVLAVNHTRGIAELHGPNEEAIAAWLTQFEPLLNRHDLQTQPDIHPRSEQEWHRSAAQYQLEVESCREAIADGDAYVLCLTDLASSNGGMIDPLSLYLRLRDAGPALRGAVIVAGDRALVSASPERFLSLRGSRLSTHPIKGTRPRHPGATEDRAAADELERDPKERAENLMIVDLMRNDLSRVCLPGTVGVSGFLRVETHPHVHQLVSSITGTIAPKNDLFDALVACFPGGSMTGAPKRRAVEMLAGLERSARGLYAGCFGWVDKYGNGELAMTIRSIELRHGQAAGGAANTEAIVGAGGGITIDSDPAREYAEKALKAAPLLAALSDMPTL